MIYLICIKEGVTPPEPTATFRAENESEAQQAEGMGFSRVPLPAYVLARAFIEKKAEMDIYRELENVS